jgi:hypothetical protein
MAQRQILPGNDYYSQDSHHLTFRYRESKSDNQHYPLSYGGKGNSRVRGQRLHLADDNLHQDPLSCQQQHGGEILQPASDEQEDSAGPQRGLKGSVQLSSGLHRDDQEGQTGLYEVRRLIQRVHFKDLHGKAQKQVHSAD